MALTKLPKDGLATGSVSTSQIEDGTIQNQEFEDSTLTSAKLADSTIANAKLSNSSFTINGTSVNLGAAITAQAVVEWQAVITADGSTTTTAVAGKGYFIDTTNHAHTINLPSSASIGDTISIKDYAEKFATNNLTIGRNSHKIQGSTNDSTINTNRALVTLVYADATKGWLFTEEHNVADLEKNTHISATGGTTLTVGDYKTHVFTSSSNFVVSAGAGPLAVAEYLVIAGGGGGGNDIGGGGGGGGFRMFSSAPGSNSPLNAPAGLIVSVQTYPITVGAGGTAGQPGQQNTNGGSSTFSTITSAGGGAGGGSPSPQPNAGDGSPGGSGGGTRFSGSYANYGGTGNTPPVSPPQGNRGGGQGGGPTYQMGGGGGAGAAGEDVNASPHGPDGGADGGVGSYIADNFIGPTAPSYGTPGPVGSTRYFSGGGGGGGYPSGRGTGGAGGGAGPSGSNATSNTGGGGVGGNQFSPINGYAGGSGIVIIRYKYQN